MSRSLKIYLADIPAQWELVNFKNVCKVRQGLQIRISERFGEPGKNRYPYITIQHLKNKTKSPEYIESPLDTVICDKDDILMTRTGNTGIVVTDVSGVFHNNFFLVDYDRSIINRDFLVSYLNSPRIQWEIIINAGTTTIPDLNHGDFYSINFPLPPLPEQRKIAEILGVWDEALELVGKQIEAKQWLKRGLMQQLLTGKLRFPGFEGKWREVKLNKLAKLLVSNVDKKSFPDEIPVVLCNYMDVYKNEYITSTIDFMPATATKAEINKFALRIGDVILTKDSETREDIASTTVVTEIADKLVCGYHLAILRPDPKQADSIFLAKLLSHGRTHQHFVSYANGATRYGLTISAIENSKVTIPSVEEQKRIAKVFLSIDREIEKLDAKVEVLRQQKQGMMQKLLTGEVRVKV